MKFNYLIINVKTLFLCIIACAITSCDNEPEGNSLNGTWQLTNASLTDGLNFTYRMGEVSWTFDEKARTVDVNNRILTTGPEEIYSGLSSGTYNYYLKKEGKTEVLYIDGRQQGAIANTSNNLVINTEVSGSGNFTKVFRR